jgi:hydroxymethylpyrimidine pyrophosphatase-like HAD family hydrolase
MRYTVLACDYDGTVAQDGKVDADTVAALERCRKSERRLILVTGRQVPDLLGAFSRPDLFDRIVAENGAILYNPADGSEHLLGAPPPAALVTELQNRRVRPLSVGRVIIATWVPNETVVAQVIRDLGLELLFQVIFNKGAIMIIPSGLDKGSGLQAALDALNVSSQDTVGIGDAENDQAFLTMCGCAAVTANALPALKAQADLVTRSGHGAGVAELIDELISSDLRKIDVRSPRHAALRRTP